MARQNVGLIAFNRGLVSPKALARVDIDRTRMSAEVMTNFLPKTQGAMTIRPGTKHFGTSLNDTGAFYIEFVSATDDVALLELTDGVMRVWLGSDAHALALLERPAVDTTVTLSDTGWSDASTGGTASISTVDAIPAMTGATTNGVTISASSQNISQSGQAWHVGDNNNTTTWFDTGFFNNALPSWLMVDFGAGNTETIASYTLRASSDPNALDNVPRSWDFQGNDVDTGSDASWTTLDTGGDQTGWAVAEKRTFTVGSPQAFRFYRWNIKEITGGGDASGEITLPEVELFPSVGGTSKVNFSNGVLTLNATAAGAFARAKKRVLISDTGTEHSLAIVVARGPVTLRVGSSDGNDDYISETALGTGYHNLAFTPLTNFYVTVESDAIANRIISSFTIGDSGTVEVTAPWTANDLDNIRYDQSADVVYVTAADVRQQKIERRGSGRSFSVVDYAPNNGPFLSGPSSAAKLSVSHFYGNTTLNSDVPFFTANHVGALVQMFHEGQSGQWQLGALDATTDPIEITGISDTGTPTVTSERRIVVAASGTYAGSFVIERSIDGDDRGFKPAPSNFGADTGIVTPNDTGTVTRTINDGDDNIKVWYRVRMFGYTSGVAKITITYPGGGITGIARITGFNSNTDVDIEVLSRFSDTGPTDNWQQGYWSDARGFPTAGALHGGRLGFAQGGSLFLSVSDDYENFDASTQGDAGPIIRTFGSGPVDSINFLISTLRLLIGTAGAELALTSSSIDEPVTPSNSNARNISTQGSSNLRAVHLDTKAIMVQRSKRRVFVIGPSAQSAFGDYESSELTLLVPDLLAAGVVSIAVQRQPDTRLHCVLADGTVAILTYEAQEDVLCWSMWETDGAVERAMVLPGVKEDAVYYHINRTVNGGTRRFLEKWAMESECLGDTGLSWLADCAVSQTDTGRTNSIAVDHLIGESVIAWGDLDTGSTPYVDLSPDVAGVQATYTVDTGGDVTLSLSQGVHHAVVGLPYTADWKSTKLAYAAQAGTALAQMKRSDRIAFVLYQTHNNALFFGSDTGHLDALPRIADRGAAVDADKIFATFDQASMAFPGLWDTDSRIVLRGKAPRPLTVLAIVSAVTTNDKV